MSQAPGKKAKPPLRVLILEDSPPDATLMARTLTAAGFELDVDPATRRDRFEELLAGEPHDVILADFSMPGFDAHAALELAKSACPTTPFICVSGVIGEEATVELLKQGADDVVLKDHLARLPFAVERALDARVRSRELREGEERYRDILEHGGVGVSYFSLDGRLLLLNRRAVENLGGGDSSQYEGKHLTELYGEKAGRTYLERNRKAAASPEPLEYVDLVELADGPRWLASVHTPSLDAAGKVVGVHAYAQDITKLKLSEDGLRRSMALLSHGERLAHVGSWQWDIASGSCVASGEWQRQHGLAGERFSNEEMAQTCHEDDREAMRAALARTAAGEPYRVDHRIVRPDTHEVRYLMTYGEPRFDADGRLETVIGASLDVTERVHADEVLYEREQRLQRALADTVAALGATVAMRDPYTSAHERRVSELACRIAEGLGWSVEAVQRMRIAALVHDVGKIAVPAEILSKPSRLTEFEFALIKAHAQAAYEILAPIDFGGPVAEIVLQHHERLDGSGYPQGLSGDEILPGARLLAVADVIEAMATHRPYRPALPLEEALAEIEAGADGRYDANACAMAVRLFREQGFTFTE